MNRKRQSDITTYYSMDVAFDNTYIRKVGKF
jgi:hypothetical protein